MSQPTANDAIRQFEQLVTAGGNIPARVMLTAYGCMDDWLPAGEHADAVDFAAAQRANLEFAEYLRSRGVEAVFVRFDMRNYLAWLDGRPDTRTARAQWTTHQ